jgi:hypothetical protein
MLKDFMKKVIYILIGLFILCGTDSFAQKKSTTSKHRDAFSGKRKKGPNVESSGGPRTKSKSKLYRHSVSKKSLKGKKKQPVFSSKKRRYKSATSAPKGKDKDKSRKSSGGRKSNKGRNKK